MQGELYVKRKLNDSRYTARKAEQPLRAWTVFPRRFPFSRVNAPCPPNRRDGSGYVLSTGSFLGEYQAGGVIVVSGLDAADERPIVSNFPCTGMHGGKLFPRSDCAEIPFPEQVTARPATPEDMPEIEEYLREFCALFDVDFDMLYASRFTLYGSHAGQPKSLSTDVRSELDGGAKSCSAPRKKSCSTSKRRT